LGPPWAKEERGEKELEKLDIGRKLTEPNRCVPAEKNLRGRKCGVSEKKASSQMKRIGMVADGRGGSRRFSGHQRIFSQERTIGKKGGGGEKNCLKRKRETSW